jgi:hypothetical protein
MPSPRWEGEWGLKPSAGAEAPARFFGKSKAKFGPVRRL